MSSISNLSVQQLRKAATLKERIQALEKELNQLLGYTVASVAGPAPKKKKFKMSASAKAKISAAAKLRWAKIKGATPAKTVTAKPAKKGKGKMSPAVKAKLSAKMKALWAARKAAKK